MDILFDPDKNLRNIAARGLSFERAAELDWNSAKVFVDARHDYGETRRLALANLEDRLHAIVFTETEKGIRVISFRKANARERRIYDQA